MAEIPMKCRTIGCELPDIIKAYKAARSDELEAQKNKDWEKAKIAKLIGDAVNEKFNNFMRTHGNRVCDDCWY
jgi:hypothetical protein